IAGDIAGLIRPNTRVIFTESPGSNTFEIQDIPAIVAVAREHDIITMMDNTWATPLYLKALDFGIDISIHAGTKYPSGHSDV
ncbi:PLP-dependent transferase, partial [Ochrobactrum sp. SFR4]